MKSFIANALIATAVLFALLPASCMKESPTVEPSLTLTDYLGTPLGTDEVKAIPAYPANNATGIPIDAKIILVFSHDMDSTTVNSTNIIITPTVVGGFSFVTSGHVVTITPASPLAYSTTYTVQATTAVKATAAWNSKPLNQNYSWQFTTAADTTAAFDPSVLFGWPQSVAGVPTYPINTTNIDVTFSEAMSGITSTTFSIYRTVAGDTTFTGPTQIAGTNTWRIVVSSSLTYASTYTIALTSGITDASGNAITPTSWSFTTETSAGANPTPAVTSYYIRNVTTTTAELVWTTNVSLSAANSRFGYGTDTTVTLQDYSGTDPDAASNNTLFIQPISGLSAGTQYYFDISCTGATTVSGSFYTSYATNPGTQGDASSSQLFSTLQLKQANDALDGSSAIAAKNGSNANINYFSTGGTNLWGVNGDTVDSNNLSNLKLFSDRNNGFFLTGESGGATFIKRVYNNAGSVGFYSSWGASAAASGATVGTGTNASAVVIYGGQGNLNVYNGFFTQIATGTATIDASANMYDFDVNLQSAGFVDGDLFVNASSNTATAVTKSTIYRYALIQSSVAINAGDSYVIGDLSTTASETFTDHEQRNTLDESAYATYTSGSGSGPYSMYSDHGASIAAAWVNSGDIVYNGTSGLYGQLSATPSTTGGLTAADTGTTYAYQYDAYTGDMLVPNSSRSWTNSYDNALILNTTDLTFTRSNSAGSPGSYTDFNFSPWVNYSTDYLALPVVLFNPLVSKGYRIYTRYCFTHSGDYNQTSAFYLYSATIAATTGQSFDFYNQITITGGQVADTPPTNPLYKDGVNFSGTVTTNDLVLNFTDVSGTPQYGLVNNITYAAQGALGLSLAASFTNNDIYQILRLADTTQSSNLLEFGITTAGSTGTTLIATDSDFVTQAVNPGDIVYNITQNSYAAVKTRNSATQLTLSRGSIAVGDRFTVFNAIVNTYDEPVIDCGLATATATGTLTDSNAAFTTCGVQAGDMIRNRATGLEAMITAVTATSLTLNPSITMTSGNGYAVYQSRVAIAYQNSGISAQIFRLNDASAYGSVFNICTTATMVRPFTAPFGGSFFVAYYNTADSTSYGKTYSGVGSVITGGLPAASGTSLGSGEITKFKSSYNSSVYYINFILQSGTTFTFKRLDSTYVDSTANTYSYGPISGLASWTVSSPPTPLATFDLDTSGNPLIAYVNTSGDIVVTKLNSASNGAVVAGFPYTITTSTVADKIYSLSIISDGSGGAVVSWIDNRFYSTVGYALFSMRITSTGTPDTSYDTASGAATDYRGKLTGILSTWDYKDVGSSLLFYDDGGAPYGALHLWYDWRSASQEIYFNTVAH